MELLATQGRVDPDDVLRIHGSEPLPAGARLMLRREGVERLPEFTASGTRASADLAPLCLAEGAWEVLLRDEAGRAEPIHTEDPGYSLDGLADYACQSRERAIHVFRTRGGLLRLFVRNAEPHAEVSAVHPAEGQIGIEGWLAYTDVASDTPGRNARLVATRRRSEEAVTGEAVLTGRRWRGALPLGPFATLRKGRAVWDLRLNDLEVSAVVDDITKKQERVRYPAQYFESRGIHVRIRPCYTDNDRLAIACTVVTAPGPP